MIKASKMKVPSRVSSVSLPVFSGTLVQGKGQKCLDDVQVGSFIVACGGEAGDVQSPSCPLAMEGAPKLCLKSYLGHSIREAWMGAPGLLSYLQVTQDTALRPCYSESHQRMVLGPPSCSWKEDGPHSGGQGPEAKTGSFLRGHTCQGKDSVLVTRSILLFP